MTTELPPTPWPWQPVPAGGVGAIGRQWAELRRPAGAEATEAVCGAITANLIAFTDRRDDAVRLGQVLWALGPRHPARVFLVGPPAPDAETGLRVAVQPRGSEALELALAPEPAASLVAPLLQADLPTLLWWHGPRPEAGGAAGADFRRWAALADRVLVDGRRWRLTPSQLAGLGRTLGPQAHLADLSWTRLTPWRQLLCQGLEIDLAALRDIRSVTLTYAAGDEAPAAPGLAATLLVGWLAHQLEWTPGARLSERRLQLQPPAGPPLTLDFEPVAASRPGPVTRLRLEAAPTAVAIEHHAGRLALSVHRDQRLLGHWAGPAGAELRSESEALSEELDVLGPDPLFEQALARGCAILDALGGAA